MGGWGWIGQPSMNQQRTAPYKTKQTFLTMLSKYWRRKSKKKLSSLSSSDGDKQVLLYIYEQ
jgi:hypothetical protein